MIEIDGSYGEGGGQLVRTACALAAITGRSCRIHDIRARRRPPGLAPQHLTAVRAVAALGRAEVEGLAPGAREFTFRPGELRGGMPPYGGEHRFDVGTAGSITLVLQACLPVAFACERPLQLAIAGGTDVRAAPPLDYFRFVFLPLLERMGLRAELTLRRRGYYPRGGGEIAVRVTPARPRALRLDERGALEEIGGVAHCANLPAHIAERMARAARENLPARPRANIREQVAGPAEAIGRGGAIVLWARCAHTILGAATVAERGVPAERLGEDAARGLAAEIAAGGTLDLHAADQALVYLACAAGPSSFTTRTLSTHALTTLWVIEQFLPLRYVQTSVGPLTRLEILPPGR